MVFPTEVIRCTSGSFSALKSFLVEEKVVVIHRGRCNNKAYYRLSYDVVTLDVDRDVSTAFCYSSSGDKVD